MIRSSPSRPPVQNAPLSSVIWGTGKDIVATTSGRCYVETELRSYQSKKRRRRDMNLATLAQRQAERHGTRLLALVDDEPVTYADLAEKSARFAGGLQDMGIRPGDRVAVMMPTRAEFLYAWFGILAAGAIEVPIHDAARGPGIAYILDTTGARAFVVDEEHVDHVADQLGGVESLQHVIVTGPKRALDKPVEEFSDLVAHDPAEVLARKPSDIASILFTGGTTGPPKGVALPHNHNLNL